MLWISCYVKLTNDNRGLNSEQESRYYTSLERKNKTDSTEIISNVEKWVFGLIEDKNARVVITVDQ